MIREINNMSLKKKFMCMFLIGVFVLAIVLFIAVEMISSSYKNLLYQSISTSLAYSSNEIEEYLEKMEDVTMMFLSDEKTQSGLSVIKDQEVKSLDSMRAIQQMRSKTSEYYQNYSDGILKYITVYTKATTIFTNILKANEVTDDMQDAMIRKAYAADGAPKWIYDHIDDHGLFLVRNIKAVESIRLETIGTILVNFDVDQLIEYATKSNQQYGQAAYVLMDDSRIIYHTDNLGFAADSESILDTVTTYGVRDINSQDYFIVHGQIADYNLNYYCLVPFEKVSRQIEHVRNLSTLLIVIVIFLVIFMFNQIFRNLMVHIQNLITKMQQFQKDNTVKPVVNYDYSNREDELGVLHQQFDNMSEATIRLIKENYINELLKKEAQISALEHQINPHFLYNTLNIIHWKATSIGEEDISNIVDALGRLLRITLSKNNDNDYRVASELEIIQSYITIQKIRYEERLGFVEDVSSTLYSYRIPKLVVQPLIENAIYYGVEENIEGCVIQLSAKKEEDKLIFMVRNNGSEVEENLVAKLESGEVKARRNGIGILNIDKRIKMLYGEAYGLNIYNDDEGVVAKLVLPIMEG